MFNEYFKKLKDYNISNENYNTYQNYLYCDEFSFKNIDHALL